MILELNKSDYKWFQSFLENYVYLTKTHVLNGNHVGENITEKITEILVMKPQKDGTFYVSLLHDEVEFFLVLLEENMCCCPGCNISSVKHRKNIANKLYKMIDTVEVIL